MKDLMKRYTEVRFALYVKKGFGDHQAAIASNYAAMDMANELKQFAKGCEEQYLRDEVEHLEEFLAA